MSRTLIVCGKSSSSMAGRARVLVGTDGVRDAWLLAQHADHDLSTQRWALELLSKAVADGEANARHEAYLIDRVRMNEGREQLYGTQMADVAGGLVSLGQSRTPAVLIVAERRWGLSRLRSMQRHLASR